MAANPKTLPSSEWLTSAETTAACQRLAAERKAEEAVYRERFEKWAIARNWNVQKGGDLHYGYGYDAYDQRAVQWAFEAFLAVARGEA